MDPRSGVFHLWGANTKSERLARCFLRDERGGVLLPFGLALVALLGFAGLATEVASWYSVKRNLQNSADLGAASGAVALFYSTGLTAAQVDPYGKQEAKASVQEHGFNDANSTITMNIPPATGTYAAAKYDKKAIEVIVQQPAPALFSRLFLSTGPTIGARAVGLVSQASDCILSTNTSSKEALQIIGNAQVTANCGVAVNSSASGTKKNAGLYVQGNGKLTANSVYVDGSIGLNDPSATITTSGSQKQNTGATVADPYQLNITWPPSGTTITSVAFPVTGGGVITGDINPASGSTVELDNGIYYVEGNINLGANVTLKSTNATIIITRNSAGTYGTFNMGANSIVNLSATTDQNSTFFGVAIAQDNHAPQTSLDSNGNCSTTSPSNCNTFQGGPNASITGAIYFPTGYVQYQGTPSSSGCTQLIASIIALGGTAKFTNNCTNIAKQFGQWVISLAE
jgi:Flp pilus assembly protein TadG